jgi:hypothetical protein
MIATPNNAPVIVVEGPLDAAACVAAHGTGHRPSPAINKDDTPGSGNLFNIVSVSKKERHPSCRLIPADRIRPVRVPADAR